MKYKHTIQIEVETQFAKPSNALEELIKQIVGPWCTKITVIKINDIGRKYTKEELTPDSGEYVGHIIARECGVPCTCDRINNVIEIGSDIMCPWHGR